MCRFITETCFLACSGDRGGAGVCAGGPRVGERGAFGQPADHQRQPAL